jgi:hypothetical protein
MTIAELLVVLKVHYHHCRANDIAGMERRCFAFDGQLTKDRADKRSPIYARSIGLAFAFIFNDCVDFDFTIRKSRRTQRTD